MELLGREGRFRVWSKRGVRESREREEKNKRRRHCSSACLQPSQAKKQEKRRSKPLYDCRDRSTGSRMSRRMRENWKEKGAKALTWWCGVRVCAEQTESKRRASLIHQPH